MNKTILIAGLVAVVTAGTALAQTQAPAPPAPGQGQGFDGPRGFRDGPGFREGRGFRGGPDGFRGRGMRQPPTVQEVQQRNAALFARIDTNRDGRATFEEFRAEQERSRLERQRAMFRRFTGEQDSVTLDQLNARSLERLNERAQRRGQDRGPGRGPGRGPAGQTPPAPPAAR
jgi:Spy/CpxP family protein refolding chaperone